MNGSYFLFCWFWDVIRFWYFGFGFGLFVHLLSFGFRWVHIAGLGRLEFLVGGKAVAVGIDLGFRATTATKNVGDTVLADSLGFSLESL